MNHNLPSLILSSLLGTASLSFASTVTNTVSSSGIAYHWGVALGGNDTANISGAVGQWSWQDPDIGATETNPVGWGHSTQWTAVTLSNASVLQLNVFRNPNVSNPAGGMFGVSNFFPSFTLWQNHDTDPAPVTFAGEPGLIGNWHEFPNNANVEWAEDLFYLDRLGNNGSEQTVSKSWTLPAGNYTVVIGGLAPSAIGAARQGYGATFTTSSVPEPGSLAFLFLTSIAALRRRGRGTNNNIATPHTGRWLNK